MAMTTPLVRAKHTGLKGPVTSPTRSPVVHKALQNYCLRGVGWIHTCYRRANVPRRALMARGRIIELHGFFLDGSATIWPDLNV